MRPLDRLPLPFHVLRGFGAGCLVASALALAAPAARAESSGGDCVWGQPGYRDCVDKLLENQRKKPSGTQAASGVKPQAQAQTGTTKKPARTRRPGAGSLDPVPPAELRLTNPSTPRLDDAIMTEQRQRQMDNNRLRYDHPVPSPIMPPNYSTTPNNGRICPSWGC